MTTRATMIQLLVARDHVVMGDGAGALGTMPSCCAHTATPYAAAASRRCTSSFRVGMTLVLLRTPPLPFTALPPFRVVMLPHLQAHLLSENSEIIIHFCGD